MKKGATIQTTMLGRKVRAMGLGTFHTNSAWNGWTGEIANVYIDPADKVLVYGILTDQGKMMTATDRMLGEMVEVLPEDEDTGAGEIAPEIASQETRDPSQSDLDVYPTLDAAVDAWFKFFQVKEVANDDGSPSWRRGSDLTTHDTWKVITRNRHSFATFLLRGGFVRTIHDGAEGTFIVEIDKSVQSFGVRLQFFPGEVA